MTDVEFVSYDEERHVDQMTQMFYEYGKWHDDNVLNRYNIHYFPDGDVKTGIDSYIPRINALEPTEGVILILMVDGEPVGMGWISRQGDDVCEVDGLFIRPEYRGKGYGKEMLKRLEDKARVYGYSLTRTEFNLFNVVAGHIFRKAGYQETSPYYNVEEIEDKNMRKYYLDKTYLEKKLNP